MIYEQVRVGVVCDIPQTRSSWSCRDKPDSRCDVRGFHPAKTARGTAIRDMVPNAVPRMILLTVAALASASRSFVRLELAGIGQYGAAPALFLEQQRGGKVLPVPIPRQSVLACEQALSPGSPAMADVLLQCRLFATNFCSWREKGAAPRGS